MTVIMGGFGATTPPMVEAQLAAAGELGLGVVAAGSAAAPSPRGATATRTPHAPPSVNSAGASFGSGGVVGWLGAVYNLASKALPRRRRAEL